jgi:hypothetical protein
LGVDGAGGPGSATAPPEDLSRLKSGDVAIPVAETPGGVPKRLKAMQGNRPIAPDVVRFEVCELLGLACKRGFLGHMRASSSISPPTQAGPPSFDHIRVGLGGTQLPCLAAGGADHNPKQPTSRALCRSGLSAESSPVQPLAHLRVNFSSDVRSVAFLDSESSFPYAFQTSECRSIQTSTPIASRSQCMPCKQRSMAPLLRSYRVRDHAADVKSSFTRNPQPTGSGLPARLCDADYRRRSLTVGTPGGSDRRV